MQAESARIRQQAEQREERVRQAADEEIDATAKRARREALAAAGDRSVLGAAEAAASGSRLPHLLRASPGPVDHPAFEAGLAAPIASAYA